MNYKISIAASEAESRNLTVFIAGGIELQTVVGKDASTYEFNVLDRQELRVDLDQTTIIMRGGDEDLVMQGDLTVGLTLFEANALFSDMNSMEDDQAITDKEDIQLFQDLREDLVDGPGEEDGEWAEGWKERSGETDE